MKDKVNGFTLYRCYSTVSGDIIVTWWWGWLTSVYKRKDPSMWWVPLMRKWVRQQFILKLSYLAIAIIKIATLFKAYKTWLGFDYHWSISPYTCVERYKQLHYVYESVTISNYLMMGYNNMYMMMSKFISKFDVDLYQFKLWPAYIKR